MSQWAPDIDDNDGVRAAFVSPGRPNVHIVHLDVQDCQADTAFMLVDLSDTTNWPHTETGHVHIAGLDIWFNPDPSFTGDISLAFLSDVDATNGTGNVIHVWHFEQDRATMVDHLYWHWTQFNAQADQWFGPSFPNSALFQTDVPLQGPDGQVNYLSGDGDLVLRVGRDAGAIDIGVTVRYETHAAA